MKTLYTILIILLLAGCYPAVNQYQSLHSAFLSGCDYFSVESPLTSEGNKQTLTATCTKAK